MVRSAQGEQVWTFGIGRGLIVIGSSLVLATALVFSAGSQGGGDSDSDGVPDGADNCIYTSNGAQSDGDADGYGDACDFDTNNDCAVTMADISAIAPHLGSVEPPDSPYDVNTDGAVSQADASLVAANSGEFTAVSGLACAECDGSPTGAGAPGPCL